VLSQSIDYYQRKTDSNEKFIARFEQIFQEKEFEAKKLLNSFIKYYPEQTLNKNIKFYNELFERKGIALYAYRNDSLIAWTEQQIPIYNNYHKDLYRKSCLKLGNGWYAVIKLNILQYKGIALILIKNEYPYQNSYLQNNFQKDFNFTDEDIVGLSETPLTDNLFFSDNSFCCGLKIYHHSHFDPFFAGASITLSFFAVLFSLIACVRNYKQYVIPKLKQYHIPLFILLLFALRGLMLYFQAPAFLYRLSFFNPSLYAYNNLFPSLGDYLLNSLLLLIVSYEIKKYVINQIKDKIKPSIAFPVIVGTVTLFYLYWIVSISGALPDNSSLSFDISMLSEITIPAILGLAGSLLLYLSGYQWVELFIDSLPATTRKKTYSYLFIFCLLLFSGFLFFSFINILSLILFSFFPMFMLYWLKEKQWGITFIYLFIAIGIVSFAYSDYIFKSVENKDNRNRKLLIDHLSSETDQIVEQLFPLLEKSLSTDSVLQKIILQKEKNQNLFELKKNFEQKYFNGYWDKYDINYFIYNRFGEPVVETGYLLNSDITYFENSVSENKRTPNSKYLYHIKNDNGKIAYLAKVSIKQEKYNKYLGVAYLLIQAKYLTDDIGFPELLLNKKLFDDQNFYDYSYAKYKNFNLISRYGKYSYPFTSASFTQTGKSNYQLFKEGYVHSVSQLPDNVQIIVSNPLPAEFYTLNIFSALLIFYLFCVVIVIGISRINQFKKIPPVTLRVRIQMQLMLVLLFSFFILGYGTIKSYQSQFNQQNLKEISSKTRAILLEIEEKLNTEKSLQNFSVEYLNYLLSRLANTFSTDISIFDKTGTLKASSKMQLFDQKLISQKINSEAFFYLSNQEKTEYLHLEKIGQLQYQSAYVPIKNKLNKTLGYLNIPYFAKQGELDNEISSFLISLINSYLILFILSIFTSLVISNRITYPLVLLKEKLSVIKLGGKNEMIAWKGSDEIASLVNEYNRMVIELMNSAEQLAQSEREGAWKEMAKQVAHEIKNPLTPIKLSVQLLERSWKDKDLDFNNKLKRFAEMLTEQVNTLSNIATEFSNFAQMPTPNVEIVNFNEIIITAVNLFKNTSQVEFKVNIPEYSIRLIADKDYLVRILNNLIKNALQAVESKKEGIIEISLSNNEKDKIKLEIRDNGIGISDEIKHKIFMPNFTTKSTGSGLGLAMVKNMMKLLGGDIYFESDKYNGTKFTLLFTEKT